MEHHTVVIVLDSKLTWKRQRVPRGAMETLLVSLFLDIIVLRKLYHLEFSFFQT